MNKLIALVCLLSPSLAFADYYSTPSPATMHPGGYHNRNGRLIKGGSIGIGGMADSGGDVDCVNCSAASGQIAGHIGGFVGPRLALMGELQGNFQTLASDYYTGDTTVATQAALMFAVQYWMTPQLWLKGGFGFATLQVERSYYGDGIVDEASVPENGMALLGAIGYELHSTRDFSVEIQGRLLNGSYSAGYQLTAGSVGVGVSWY